MSSGRNAGEVSVSLEAEPGDNRAHRVQGKEAESHLQDDRRAMKFSTVRVVQPKLFFITGLMMDVAYHLFWEASAAPKGAHLPAHCAVL